MPCSWTARKAESGVCGLVTDHQAQQTRSARVIVASNRAAAGVYPDRTGPIIAQWLAARGFAVEGPLVVPDGEPVGAALREAVGARVHVVITTGGTGISPTDRTEEHTSELQSRENLVCRLLLEKKNTIFMMALN